MATMLIFSLSSDFRTGCNSSSVTAKSPSTIASSSLPANAAHVLTPMSLPSVTPCIFAGRPNVNFTIPSFESPCVPKISLRGTAVIDFSYSACQFVSCAFAFDVHEVNFGVVEEEMIMQRGNAEPVVERSGHCGIHFVLEKNGVAHHHRFGVRAFYESSPSTETHEWRHAPSIDNDLHVGARKGDFINAFLLIHFSLEPGQFVDARRVQVSSERTRDESEESCCATNEVFYHDVLYRDCGVIS